MEIFVCKFSDCGGRRNNEDSVAITEDTFVVADGLGGHGYGEVASNIATKHIIDNYADITAIDNLAMHRVIETVNMAVRDYKKTDSKYADMATTVVAAFVRDNLFNYVNVGDSRLYYFRKGKIFFRSKDHSVTQLCLDMGEIKEKDMRFHPDRNKLTKALGLTDNIKVNQEFVPFEIEPGDAILLCTDGFWEYVIEKEMVKALRKSDTPHKWLDGMMKFVNKRTPDNHDNLSAVCVMIK